MVLHCDERTLPGGRALPCGCAPPVPDPDSAAAELDAAAPVLLWRALLPWPPLVQLCSCRAAAAGAAGSSCTCCKYAACLSALHQVYSDIPQRSRHGSGGVQEVACHHMSSQAGPPPIPPSGLLHDPLPASVQLACGALGRRTMT